MAVALDLGWPARAPCERGASIRVDEDGEGGRDPTADGGDYDQKPVIWRHHVLAPPTEYTAAAGGAAGCASTKRRRTATDQTLDLLGCKQIPATGNPTAAALLWPPPATALLSTTSSCMASPVNRLHSMRVNTPSPGLINRSSPPNPIPHPSSALTTRLSPPISNPHASPIDIDPTPAACSNPRPLPFGWEKCLDLQTGEVFYTNSASGVRTAQDPREPMGAAVTYPADFLAEQQLIAGPTQKIFGSKDAGPVDHGANWPASSSMSKSDTDLALALKPITPLKPDYRGISNSNSSTRKSKPIYTTESGNLELSLDLPNSSFKRSAPDRRTPDSSCTLELLSTNVLKTDVNHIAKPSRLITSVHGSSSTVIVGCPCCFMYVMVSKLDPKCPKCRSRAFPSTI